MKTYKIIDIDGNTIESPEPGTLGGYKRKKIYGKLDCKNALSHISKGQYVQHRVFFADEETAIAAGYRPCGKCMPDRYRDWKSRKGPPDSLNWFGKS